MERGFLLLLIELLAIFKFCSCFFFLAGLFADWVVCFFRGLCRFCTFACWRFIVDRFWKFRFWRMRLKNYSQFRVKWGRTNVIVSYYWMVCGGDVDLWLARWFWWLWGAVFFFPREFVFHDETTQREWMAGGWLYFRAIFFFFLVVRDF